MPLYFYLQLIFFLSELSLLLFKRAKSGKIKNERDRRSLLRLWVVIATALSAGPCLAFSYHIWALGNYRLVEIVSIAIFVLGFIIRWSAIYQLGNMFTVNVVISDTHILKTSGLYKGVRHPSYLGLLLIVIGLGVSLDSGLSLLVMLVLVFIVLSHRINVEEQALTEEFGEQYIDYKKRVKKLIPGIY